MEEGSTNKLRSKIKKQISSLSIEELQQLKSEMGLKAYNDSVGNPSSLSKHKNTLRLKRDNKNRPRETSSKKTVSRKRKIIDEAMPEPKRDPRFDSACGEFNEKIFKDAYTFVDKIKDKEQKHLKERLETETDQEELQKIKYLIQRHDNQVREKRKLEKKKKDQSTGDDYKDIINRYDSLKKQGGLDKYMLKKEKKLAIKSKKRLQS
ncbi:ribosomal RNA processing protein 36 homolog [Lepeophtheirus salmonis]|uniref:ribosomal RNA processing protein 36 homolog n=1 Tax=Lepeophtheirus salmonis TaxID=72036 RepID=UPI00077F2E3E|nr:ribosomal RNA processing protein 36 homolog [Lepeophtheirus salmonis]XP_040576103.1 ribosomal RNA processing protein 36 homolog [Lepeophtheirus salmonis]